MKKLILSISAFVFGCLQLNAQVPNLIFSNTYVSSGAVNDEGRAIKALRNGNVAFAGKVTNANPIPLSASAYAGGGYVGVHNEVGAAKWVSPIFADYAQVATDAQENIYMIGSFTGNALAYNGTTMSSVGTNSLGSNNIVIAKYSVTGTLQWVKAIGSIGNEYGTGIAADANGDIYVTGYHNSGGTGNVDFEVGNPSASFNISFKSFIVKLTTNGNYVWHKTIPVGGYNYHAIAIDGNNVYLATQTNGTQDMNAGGTPFMVGTFGYDIILAKYRKDGAFVTAKAIGGCTNVDYARGLEVKNGKLAMFGTITTGTCNPNINMNGNTGAPSLTITSNINIKQDGFIAMYDTNLVCQWAKPIGGPDASDEVWGGEFDNAGNLLLSGKFSGTNTNFNIGGTGTYTASAGSTSIPDYFYASYNVGTGNCNWVYRGGTPTGTEVAYDITCDSIGKIWTTGVIVNSGTANDMFINKHFCSMNSNSVTLIQSNSGNNTFTLTPYLNTVTTLQTFSKETCLAQTSTFTVLPNSTNDIKITLYDFNNNMINSPNLSMAYTSTAQVNYGFKILVKDTITNCETVYNYQSSYVDNMNSSFLNVIAKPGYSLGPVCQGNPVGLGIAAGSMSGPTFNWTANGSFLLSTTGTSVIVTPTITTTYIAYANDGLCEFNGSAATVTVNVCTSVSESDKGAGISIYPNPASDILNVRLENFRNSSISIYSVDGQLIKTESLSADNNKILISDLSNGIYFITISYGSQKDTYKIIKQ